MRRRAVGSLLIAVALSVMTTAVVPAQTVPASTAPQYYLSLGDSLAQGVQPNAAGVNVETNLGYADDLYAIEKSLIPHLRLAKLGCPGETTTTMIYGGICSYRGASQLVAATAFLETHRVALVTIDIGANNVDGCIVNGVVDPICLIKGVTAAHNDLPIILGVLRAVAPTVRIRAMSYYDPFLAAWFQGPAGQSLAKQSVGLTTFFNGILGAIYRTFNVRIADVESTFQTSNFTIDPATGLPLNVELICAWTWMCAPAPVGPNIHANAAGYAAIAGTFAATIRPPRA